MHRWMTILVYLVLTSPASAIVRRKQKRCKRPFFNSLPDTFSPPRWTVIAALAIFIFAVEVSRAEIATSSRVDVSTSVNIPGEESRSGVKITDGVSVSETVSVEGGFASATADSGSLQAVASGRSSVPGAMVGSGASGSTNIFVVGPTYAITGVYGTSGGGLVNMASVNFGGAGVLPSLHITSGTSLTVKALASSGSSNPNDYATGHAAVMFVIHLANETPVMPGSNNDVPITFQRGGGVDINDLRATPAEDNDNTTPAITTGINLTPVFGSFGRTNFSFVGPPVDNTPVGSGQAINIVTGYRYSVAENMFTHFTMPAALPGGDNALQVEVGGNIVPYTPGDTFDLTQYVAGGVDEFFLSGIDVTEDFRLNEVAPFVSGIRFANDGLADIRITPADVAPILVGDFNDDNLVDTADYVVWRKFLGGPLPHGEAYSPGVADEADYNGWVENRGAHRGSNPESPGAAAPEPSALLLALFGAALVLSLSRSDRASKTH